MRILNPPRAGDSQDIAYPSGDKHSSYAATSPEVREKHFSGTYLNDPGSPGKETAQCSDPVLGMALWDLSNRLVSDKLGSSALLSWVPE